MSAPKLVNVPCLEDSDMNEKGDIISDAVKALQKGRPGIIMMQGGFCGHCNKAKPDFSEFAKQGKYFAATIEIDGPESAKALNKKLSAAFGSEYQGVPHYFKVDAQGKFAGHVNTGRSVEKLNAAMSM